MHAAPSVNYPVGRSAFALGLATGVAALGLAAATAFMLQSAGFGWRQLAAFALPAACAMLALAAWLRSPAGVLRWDGRQWQWEQGPAAATGRPEVALDLQVRLLLRWQGDDGHVRWLWAERHSDQTHWEALRRAVYSRASAPIPTFPPAGKERPPAGEPPAAEQ